MRIFVAGATGVVGVRLVPALARQGHQVVGTTRTPEKVERLRALGAEPVVLDALDATAVKEAVALAEPEVVVHQLTAIPGSVDPRHFDEQFAQTNRLRTEGLDHLLDAAAAGGSRRFVAQSFASWPYARVGGPVKDEEDPLDPDPPAIVRTTLDAIRYLETAVASAGMEGVVLRYGGFYGPGTSLGEGGSVLDAVRRRRFPIVGSGAGVWSFVHVDDVATATVAAIEGGEPGTYNVTDDEPATVAEWLPVLAESIGAPAPWHVPAWLARVLIGEAGVTMMTDIHGASNAKAKRQLGWSLRYPSWRDGFRNGLE
jgi:nucleoside-diphosphate-sugar epimerase